MFSRWNNARLRVAENALADGRIDEAFERLAAPELDKVKRAKKLRDSLARALAARARLAAQGGRYGDAICDLNRVGQIGHMDSDTEALLKRVTEEQRRRAERHAAHGDAFNRAAREIRDGRLETGQLAVDQIENASQRERLREDLELRVRRSAQLLERVRELLANGDMLAACRCWDEACQRHGCTDDASAAASKLARACREALHDALVRGKLDRAWSIYEATAMLRLQAPELAEFDRFVRLARDAAEKTASTDYAGAQECLLRLQAAFADADWIGRALKLLDQIVHARTELLSTPLGLLGASLRGTRHQQATFGRGRACAPTELADSVAPAPAGAQLGAQSLLLLVDGTGSLLLSSRDILRLGRAGGGAAVDVPIPADIQSHHADIVREGEDYFLIAHGSVNVNRAQVQRALLRHGDKVQLGSGAKLVFHKPSAKSDTATLLLSSRCRLPMDISVVVLFKNTCLLGPQSSCHVRTREGDTRLVLFDRDGVLHVRRAARDGRPTGPAEVLPLRRTCDFGDIRLTVKEYDVGGAGGPA